MPITELGKVKNKERNKILPQKIFPFSHLREFS